MAKQTAKKIEKRKKDPLAPKRPLSAYMFYSQVNRERVKKENPDITFGQIGKILGREWSELSDKEKDQYIEKAKKDKERYDREMTEYKAK
ncbi:high mobility group box domain-containing protein [Halteromyces radiatus]|uniref:high mobility group box domain-containing protein n=1 Tax=Halteromyces radiatus TaxID=101107 RepID=UPI00222049B2|nr:high mobility group box domain-containing protein [Halteromyces radiatus]KAI8097424.1 high mobility group box domain-containing protein [Halteromyces radiatus]